MPINRVFSKTKFNSQPLEKDLSDIELKFTSNGKNIKGYCLNFVNVSEKGKVKYSSANDSSLLTGINDAPGLDVYSIDPQRPEILAFFDVANTQEFERLLKLKEFEASINEFDLKEFYKKLIENESTLQLFEKRLETYNKSKEELKNVYLTLTQISTIINEFKKNINIAKPSDRLLDAASKKRSTIFTKQNTGVDKTKAIDTNRIFFGLDKSASYSNTTIVQSLALLLLFSNHTHFASRYGQSKLSNFDIIKLQPDPVNQYLEFLSKKDVSNRNDWIELENKLPSELHDRLSFLSEAIAYELNLTKGINKSKAENVSSTISNKIDPLPNIIRSKTKNKALSSLFKEKETLPLETSQQNIDGTIYKGIFERYIQPILNQGKLEFDELKLFSKSVSNNLGEYDNLIKSIKLIDEPDERLESYDIIIQAIEYIIDSLRLENGNINNAIEASIFAEISKNNTINGIISRYFLFNRIVKHNNKKYRNPVDFSKIQNLFGTSQKNPKNNSQKEVSIAISEFTSRELLKKISVSSEKDLSPIKLTRNDIEKICSIFLVDSKITDSNNKNYSLLTREDGLKKSKDSYIKLTKGKISFDSSFLFGTSYVEEIFDRYAKLLYTGESIFRETYDKQSQNSKNDRQKMRLINLNQLENFDFLKYSRSDLGIRNVVDDDSNSIDNDYLSFFNCLLSSTEGSSSDQNESTTIDGFISNLNKNDSPSSKISSFFDKLELSVDTYLQQSKYITENGTVNYRLGPNNIKFLLFQIISCVLSSFEGLKAVKTNVDSRRSKNFSIEARVNTKIVKKELDSLVFITGAGKNLYDVGIQSIVTKKQIDIINSLLTSNDASDLFLERYSFYNSYISTLLDSIANITNLKNKENISKTIKSLNEYSNNDLVLFAAEDSVSSLQYSILTNLKDPVSIDNKTRQNRIFPDIAKTLFNDDKVLSTLVIGLPTKTIEYLVRDSVDLKTNDIDRARFVEIEISKSNASFPSLLLKNTKFLFYPRLEVIPTFINTKIPRDAHKYFIYMCYENNSWVPRDYAYAIKFVMNNGKLSEYESSLVLLNHAYDAICKMYNSFTSDISLNDRFELYEKTNITKEGYEFLVKLQQSAIFDDYFNFKDINILDIIQKNEDDSYRIKKIDEFNTFEIYNMNLSFLKLCQLILQDPTFYAESIVKNNTKIKPFERIYCCCLGNNDYIFDRLLSNKTKNGSFEFETCLTNNILVEKEGEYVLNEEFRNKVGLFEYSAKVNLVIL